MQLCLHRIPVWLDLPTMITGSVIGEIDKIARHLFTPRRSVHAIVPIHVRHTVHRPAHVGHRHRSGHATECVAVEILLRIDDAEHLASR